MKIIIESNQKCGVVPENVMQYFKSIMEKHYNSEYALMIRCCTNYYKMNIIKLKGDRLSTEKYGICAINQSTGEVFANQGGLCKLNPIAVDKITI